MTWLAGQMLEGTAPSVPGRHVSRGSDGALPSRASSAIRRFMPRGLSHVT